MSAYPEDLLAARFAALAPEPVAADWLDVQRRARRGGRRRALALTVAAAVAVILVGSALGVGPRILDLSGWLDFLGAEPAPKAIVTQFTQHRRVMKSMWGENVPVAASEARTIIDVKRPDGSTAYIAAAPMRGKDGFCFAINAFGARGGGGTGAGCVDAKQAKAHPLVPGGGSGYKDDWEQTGWRDFAGYVTRPGTDHLVLRYEDRSEDTVSVVWVSEPIDAGFFAFQPAPGHDAKGHRAIAMVAVDAGGRELARVPFTYQDPNDPWSFPRTRTADDWWPPAIDEATVHRLRFEGLPSWVDRVEIGRGRGGFCWAMTEVPAPDNQLSGLGGGCVKPGDAAEKRPLETFGPTGELVGGRPQWGLLIEGVVPAAVESVEFRFQDGRKTTVRPQERVVVYAIPADRYPHGKRLTAAVLLDGAGSEVKRIAYDPGWEGVYRHLPTP